MTYMSEPVEEKVNIYQPELVSDRLLEKYIDCIWFKIYFKYSHWNVSDQT